VKLLLDTHIFLWLNTEPERLKDRLSLIEDRRTELVLSAVSSWEIAIKHASGKLSLPESPELYVPSRMREVNACGLAVEHAHALAVATLPPIHRDPFDRLLVAQAKMLRLPILTADPIVARYPVEAMVVTGDQHLSD
jgi:PIN domain nuclease of toxin-antitoxin system